jgi:hypothetical protein
MKKPKVQVDYSQGMKTAHCGICTNFMSPNRCKVVLGNISPECWCKRFSKK